MSDVSLVRQVIDEHFPGLWPAVDLGLSTCATLLLADNSNPAAVVFVGGPSSSKTTVAEMFADHTMTYLSDNFTPAAFVSHAANVKRQHLASVDLLPRIKYKVLVTPELAPIFRGKEDELIDRFKIITRVLDGQGLQSDSGTHGRRGYRGDYLFAWIGCTTPFEPKVWRVMVQLGSRLFFFVMDSGQEVTVKQLVNVGDQVPYRVRLQECRAVVHRFLTSLFKDHGGVRGVQWQAARDPHEVRSWIALMAKLVVAMRSEPGNVEQPWRAQEVLINLACSHALVHGRRQLSKDDLPLVAQVAASSMPTEYACVFRALVQSGGKGMTVAQVQMTLGVRHPATARQVMENLAQTGVMDCVRAGVGRPAFLRFASKWKWCGPDRFRDLLH